MGNYWDELMESDEGAASYMETYGEGPGAPTRHTLASFINDGESVLDVGCGPGWNYDHFLEYGPAVKKYLGMDYSERFVRVANNRHSGLYTLGDVRHIDQPKGSWDVVILQDVLEHTNGYRKPVKDALDVAKKRVVVTFWRMGGGDEDQINDDGNDGYGAAYSRKRWEKFLNSLDYAWFHHQITDSKARDFYVIDKEEDA